MGRVPHTTTTLAIRVGVALALVLVLACFSTQSPAQENQLSLLAKQSAAALSHAGKHRVVVLDFTGAPGTDALGAKLAADFRDALQRETGASLKVEDRAATLERLTELSLEPANLRSPDTMRWVYKSTTVDAYITGTLTDDSPSNEKLTVQIHNLTNPTQIAEFSATIPLLADLKALIVSPPRDDFSALTVNGAAGTTAAVCITCAQATYSTEAANAKVQGTVIVAFTITKRGHVKDVRVKQALPHGLTQQAVNAVLAWKFKPAKDSRGKRIDVRQLSEIDFRLY